MEHFFTLTPERVLDAVEGSGHATTGLCYPLNSLENRVYEVELDDRSRVVAKFYRPGRWTEATIRDEHHALAALAEAEIPVCAPIAFPDGDTLNTTGDGIFVALFPRTGGRIPEELRGEEYEQLGRLVARIHNVLARIRLPHRPVLSPQTYGAECLETICERAVMPPALRERYVRAVERLIAVGEPRFAATDSIVTHADCHRGNLLRGRDGWFFLDFDDMAVAPPVQDVWLLLPARPRDCPQELDALLAGYQQFRRFDRGSLALIEVLRGLRYVRYAAWIARRWDDPAFTRAFPDWGTERYWQGQLTDLHDQLTLLEDGDSYP
jgi:Ser/Thr protein kinase RdoA (MazF antagonist)